ncbi:hypothetical protein JL101_036045 (plasmid) [Skermanella rosea]|uniref:hypothetical protein n=1 Tax=Skermanella rosea TaxID=1817965 RepID=UPI00193284AD|nr:hypothetical protein [Skermanella rosea]UEM08172.1 hypothetical protein JL101_036045 [Skermanella rosea]
MGTLQQALDDKDTLVLDIEFADGDRQTRCPASIFWLGTSLLWADPGWPTTPSHAFHLVPGELEGEGPWILTPADAEMLARITVRELVPGEQPATEEFLVWETYRASPEGRPFTSAAALEAAAAFFSLDV